MKNRLLILAVSAVTGCTTPHTMAAPDMMGPFNITLSRNLTDSRAKLEVTIKNVTRAPLCLKAEAVNPDSYEMDLWLRDSRGGEVRHREPGFLPEPMAGIVRIEPTESVSSHYDINGRFVISKTKSASKKLYAKAAFTFDDCKGSTPSRAVSDWQLI